MQLFGQHYRTIWHQAGRVFFIDQCLLPFEFKIFEATNADAMIEAIRCMQVRGAPLIGIAGAFGVYLAARDLLIQMNETIPANADTPITDQQWQALLARIEPLAAARPTAINLKWGIDGVINHLQSRRSLLTWSTLVTDALQQAQALADEEVRMSAALGATGADLIESMAQAKQRAGQCSTAETTFNILTHCNAGWLATIDIGLATAPIFMARDRGVRLHVWVDETRPRLQGARLTAFELGQEGISHTIIADNAAGYLMQQRKVDMVIVGTDRVSAQGDVTNKVGTYLKALAADANHVPFYVALPSSSIDWQIDQAAEIPIEERASEEVLYVDGLDEQTNQIRHVRIASPESTALNIGFDVTPARYISGFFTEKGFCQANAKAMRALLAAQSPSSRS